MPPESAWRGRTDRWRTDRANRVRLTGEHARTVAVRADDSAAAALRQWRVRKFNTEGPIRADRHYHIPPLTRIDLDDVLGLVRDEKYFVLHAPRQTGKTSVLLALRDLLNSGQAERRYPER